MGYAEDRGLAKLGGSRAIPARRASGNAPARFARGDPPWIVRTEPAESHRPTGGVRAWRAALRPDECRPLGGPDNLLSGSRQGQEPLVAAQHRQLVVGATHVLQKPDRPGYNPEMGDTRYQFRLRELLIATGLIAAVLGGYLYVDRTINDVHREAARSAYQNGRMTLKQARALYGDEVDAWEPGTSK
jgi:hypothetical protein